MANLDSLIRFLDLFILAFEACGVLSLFVLVGLGYSRLSLVTICELFQLAIKEDTMKCSREYWICLDLIILGVCMFCPLFSLLPASQQRMQIF